MKKYVLYQSEKTVGVVSKEQRPQYAYENEIKPIRVLLCNITDDWALKLLELFRQDKSLFIDVVKKELNRNLLTCYMN